MWHAYKNRLFVSKKENEVLTLATARINLGNLMLSERKQTKRTHLVWFHLREMSKTSKPIETDSTWATARGWEKGRLGSKHLQVWAFFLGWRILELDSDDGHTALWIYKKTHKKPTELHTVSMWIVWFWIISEYGSLKKIVVAANTCGTFITGSGLGI